MTNIDIGIPSGDLVDLPLPAACHCGHPISEHDRIATRYCAATTDTSPAEPGHTHTRTCICVPTPSSPLDRHNGRGQLE